MPGTPFKVKKYTTVVQDLGPAVKLKHGDLIEFVEFGVYETYSMFIQPNGCKPKPKFALPALIFKKENQRFLWRASMKLAKEQNHIEQNDILQEYLQLHGPIV